MKNLIRILQVILLLLVVQGIYSLVLSVILKPFTEGSDADLNLVNFGGTVLAIILGIILLLVLERYRTRNNESPLASANIQTLLKSKSLRVTGIGAATLAILAITGLILAIFVLPFLQ